MAFKRMGAFFSKLATEQQLFRRLILLWAMAILTMWTCFLMDVTLLTSIGAAGATVVTGIFGILATVISFYQWHRDKEDERREGCE